MHVGGNNFNIKRSSTPYICYSLIILDDDGQGGSCVVYDETIMMIASERQDTFLKKMEKEEKHSRILPWNLMTKATHGHVVDVQQVPVSSSIYQYIISKT